MMALIAKEGSGNSISFDTSDIKYAAYMRRLKEAIESAWHYPADVARRRGKLNKRRRTVLAAATGLGQGLLHRKGTLRIQTARTVAELDSALSRLNVASTGHLLTRGFLNGIRAWIFDRMAHFIGC